MLFSIIIPVYNTEDYLPQCLDSVLRQAYDDYEVICVDDGSSDGSVALLEHYAQHHPQLHIVQQDNQGVGYARNVGLDCAQGDYILFLDSDDWIEPDTLQSLAAETDGVDMICFGGRRYFNQRQRYETADPLQKETGLTGWQYYCRHALEPRNIAFVCVPLRCYRRQMIIDNNIRFKEGIYHEDNLFTPLVCYHAQSVKVLDRCLYTYRVREHSIMTSRNIIHWQNLIATANMLAVFFADKDDVDRTIVYRSITHHYQAAFAASDKNNDTLLSKLVDWHSYRRVSRTKLRHRLQYTLIRHCPYLFRLTFKLCSIHKTKKAVSS